MAENKLFRKTALDTVSNPEQLDQHIRVTRPTAWVILIAILSFVVSIGIWSFTGNVSSGTDITGIMFASEGIMISNANKSGTVTDVLVSEGQQVEKGDILCVIPDEELLAQISATKAEYEAASGSKKQSLGAMLDDLRYQYMINSFIGADKAGMITQLPLIGHKVTEGQRVAVNLSQEKMSGSKEVIAYVPYSIASSFKIGEDVQVSPVNAPREEYGYILGKITNIGETIVTEEMIVRTMGTTKYVSGLDISPDSVEVRIRLNADSSTKSGFEWSNSKGGESISAEIGTPCKIKVMSEEVHPIDLII